MKSRAKKKEFLKKERREEGGLKGERDGKRKMGWRIGGTRPIWCQILKSHWHSGVIFANFSHTSISK